MKGTEGPQSTRKCIPVGETSLYSESTALEIQGPWNLSSLAWSYISPASTAKPELLTSARAPGSLLTGLSTNFDALGLYVRMLLTQRRSRHKTWIDRSNSYRMACEIEGLRTCDVSILQSYESIPRQPLSILNMKTGQITFLPLLRCLLF